MTLAISHKEGQKAIVDYIAETRPPFDLSNRFQP